MEVILLERVAKLLGEVLVCRLTGAPAPGLDPALVLIRTSRATFSGWARATCRAARPPSSTGRMPRQARDRPGGRRSPQVGLDVRRPTMAGRVRQHKGAPGRPEHRPSAPTRPRSG